MASMWLAEEGIRDTMIDLIRKYHPHLALFIEEIAIVFKEKASGAGTTKVIGKSGKASPILSVLSGGKDWKFVITLAADAWQTLSTEQQVALLDHHLCSLKVEEDSETGNQKFFVAIPDAAFFRDEVERHGFWRHTTKPAKVTDVSLDEIFGEKSSADEQKAAADAPTKKKGKTAEAA